MSIQRPILRYYGGKWNLAPWIVSYFPDHQTYTEVYGGAASVLLQKPRCAVEVYNDLDGEIVNVFRVLRDPVQSQVLIAQLALTPYARMEWKESHLPADDPGEQARRTIFRSWSTYGPALTRRRCSTFQALSTRKNNLAAGWASFPDQIQGFIDRLRGVVIEQRPAVSILQRFDGPHTLHYVDPPYPHGERYESTGYRHEMTDDDHRALAGVLHNLAGMVILSGYPCNLYDQELYPDWLRVTKQSRNDRGAIKTEVLWLNPAAANQQQSRML